MSTAFRLLLNGRTGGGGRAQGYLGALIGQVERTGKLVQLDFRESFGAPMRAGPVEGGDALHEIIFIAAPDFDRAVIRRFGAVLPFVPDRSGTGLRQPGNPLESFSGEQQENVV